ncbi:MAG: HAMP domain-containing histidine kinase, partial [Anaerolineae bacterium]|nr:HAMP domain-containing histidine kinase [Anaerolineae bacterium]
AGKVELSLEEFSLDDVVREVVETLSPTASEKGLELLTEVPEGITLFSDKRRIKQVLMNLVSNAVKYTPAGGSVAVRAWSEDDQIKAEVSDTGIGISEKALPRIFEEFYRAQNAKSMEMEGTGLGLAIARDVVEQHGGQITVESVVGEGSTFYVTLPQER